MSEFQIPGSVICESKHSQTRTPAEKYQSHFLPNTHTNAEQGIGRWYMKWTHLIAHSHTLSHTNIRSQTHAHKRTCVCVCVYKAPAASVDDPHPQHQAHAPVQVMGRGHRMPLEHRLLCRPRALRLLVCRCLPCRCRSLPLRAAHQMSHLTAHPTTPLGSPLVHESHRSRSEAVRL